MINIVILTRGSKKVFVNFEKVLLFQSDVVSTKIIFNGTNTEDEEYIMVKETPDEIIEILRKLGK